MLNYRFALFVLIVLSHPVLAHAQFGSKLKEKLKQAGQKVSELAKEEFSESKNELDTTTYAFAISFADDAVQFEEQENLQKAYSLMDKTLRFLDDQDEATPEQRAADLNEAGEIAYKMNKFKWAENSFTASMKLYEETGINSDERYFRVVANLGLLYHAMGRFQKANEFTNEALTLRQSYLGEQHNATAVSHNNLGVLYKDQGQYLEARDKFDRASEIFELNEHESGGIITQNNRAMLQQTLGNYSDAESHYNAALTLARNSKVMREKSNNYQRMMVNLAFMYQEKGEYDKAESIYLEILEQKRKQLKSKNADYAHILNNLAALYLLMNKNELAGQNLKEALSIFEQKLGSEHPAYAHSLQNMGVYYRINGEYSQANEALTECLVLKKNIYGAGHPEYYETLEQQAIVNWLMGEEMAAQDMYQNVLNAELEYIQTFMPAMSEAEKSRYWARNRQKFNRYYALLAQNETKDQSILRKALTYQGQTKALLMNVSNKIRSLILSSNNTELLHLYNNWVDTKELLMQYYGLSKEELTEQKVNLDSLQRKSEDYERQLSERSDLFNSAIDDQKNLTDAASLAPALRSDEVLVEFIRIEPDATLDMKSASYLALVLHSDGDIASVYWKNGGDMDGKYYKYYLNAIKNYIEDDISYGVYWKKLDDAIGSSKRIYMVADGIYHQVNPLTFKKPTGGYLIRDHEIVHLTNNKDLLQKASGQKLSSALIIGNPAFGNPDISPLPGTANETQAINATLKNNGYNTTLLQGGEATEAALRLYEGNNIIHVATHGFFIRDTDNKQAAAFGIQPEYMVDNPLLRSGLLMAGAGETMENYDPMMRNSATNGIVTSYEILNLNFPKTQMVVLSACETGLGEIRSGEGVYGLQRAFQVAGVPQLVMSLWKVDDNATEQLMKNYYANLQKGMSAQKALHSAQISLISKWEQPKYWGAFIAIGM